MVNKGKLGPKCRNCYQVKKEGIWYNLCTNSNHRHKIGFKWGIKAALKRTA